MTILSSFVIGWITDRWLIPAVEARLHQMGGPIEAQGQ